MMEALDGEHPNEGLSATRQVLDADVPMQSLGLLTHFVLRGTANVTGPSPRNRPLIPQKILVPAALGRACTRQITAECCWGVSLAYFTSQFCV